MHTWQDVADSTAAAKQSMARSAASHRPYCSHSQKIAGHWATVFDPFLVNPVRRIAALDSGFSLDLSCSSGEFGCERLDPGLSDIAQQNFETWINIRGATS
jgi:hypothetical protein